MDANTSLVPANNKPLRRRDPRGLRLNQKKALVALSQQADWKTAAAAAGVSVDTLQEWLANDVAFQAQYDSLLSGFFTEIQGRMTALLPRVGEVMQEGLDANAPTEVEGICPHCEQPFKTTVQVPAWAVRLRVVEDILKHKGLLSQKLEVSGSIEHQHITLTAEESIGLQRYRRFGPDSVPAGFIDELRARGHVIEGEFTELPPPP
jgi:hypothetical protein